MGSDADRRINIGKYPTIVAAKIQECEEGDYVVKHWLYKDSLAMIYGASNSGKSFLAVDIGMHVSYDMPWHANRITQGLVLYIAAEGASSIKRRVAAFQRGRDRGNWGFHIIDASPNFAVNDDNAIRVVNTCALLEARHVMEVSLIIIDTLAMTTGGSDENSSKEMGDAIDNIKLIQNETGACVLMIHHSGKDHTRGARGSSALRAAVDTEIEVRSAKEGDIQLHAARVTKQRDAERADDFNFKLKQIVLGQDKDGEPLTSCIVSETDYVCPDHDDPREDKPRVVKMPVMQTLALEALAKEKTLNGNDSIGTIMWRDAFRMHVNDRLGKEPTKHEWANAKNGLQAKDLVSFNKKDNTFS